ncbi:MAG: hypothetical protein FWC77_07570 [Defluviitaleaceae bacterium]|nr:hypothetical protein [Defluviitaleaceae bacterium]
MATKVKDLIETQKVYAGLEVIAEVIYVLKGVYKLSRSEIAEGLQIFFSHESLQVESMEVLMLSLKIYAVRKLDFVDTVLYAKNVVYGYDVFTFDKKLVALLQQRFLE